MVQIYNQFTGEYINVPDLMTQPSTLTPQAYAEQYTASLPTQPLLQEGFTGYLNPSTYMDNPDLRDVVSGGVNYIFNPFERFFWPIAHRANLTATARTTSRGR